MLDSSSDSPNQNRLMHIYVFVAERWMLFISQRTKDREHFGDAHTCAICICAPWCHYLFTGALIVRIVFLFWVNSAFVSQVGLFLFAFLFWINLVHFIPQHLVRTQNNPLTLPRLKAVVYHQRSLHTRSPTPAGPASFMSQSMDEPRQAGGRRKTSLLKSICQNSRFLIVHISPLHFKHLAGTRLHKNIFKD